MTVALYTRLSPKPNGGGYEGVDDQITWGTDLRREGVAR